MTQPTRCPKCGWPVFDANSPASRFCHCSQPAAPSAGKSGADYEREPSAPDDFAEALAERKRRDPEAPSLIAFDPAIPGTDRTVRHEPERREEFREYVCRRDTLIVNNLNQTQLHALEDKGITCVHVIEKSAYDYEHQLACQFSLEIDALKAKVEYWEKHHMESHDEWLKKETAPLYESNRQYSAEIEKLRASLDAVSAARNFAWEENARLKIENEKLRRERDALVGKFNEGAQAMRDLKAELAEAKSVIAFRDEDLVTLRATLAKERDERDAAVRARDEARAECQRLEGELKAQFTLTHKYATALECIRDRKEPAAGYLRAIDMFKEIVRKTREIAREALGEGT